MCLPWCKRKVTSARSCWPLSITSASTLGRAFYKPQSLEECSSMSTILIVDDNQTNLLLARAVLEGRGYQVGCVSGGSEMNSYLQQTTPSLILMDVQMPEEDGLSITRRLKA